MTKTKRGIIKYIAGKYRYFYLYWGYQNELISEETKSKFYFFFTYCQVYYRKDKRLQKQTFLNEEKKLREFLGKACLIQLDRFYGYLRGKYSWAATYEIVSVDDFYKNFMLYTESFSPQTYLSRGVVS